MAKVMEVINNETGLARCKVCGHERVLPTYPGSKKFSPDNVRRGEWQCAHGCKPKLTQAQVREKEGMWASPDGSVPPKVKVGK